MAKSSGKKIRNEGQYTGRSTAKKHFKKLRNKKSTDVVYSAENRVMGPVVDGSGFSLQKTEEFSGFIFMCNGKTKPECYVNRVFGLPPGKREVVEKIKPGMKLFLFDFDVKLLYGVYEASSNGAMNLEPAAFGERFPAQVRFRICKDCLPLHLNSFRNAIIDNFQGCKFAPELNGQQVRDLLLLFRPIVLPSPSVHHYGAPELRMPPPPINGQLNPSLTPPLQTSYRPYLTGQTHILPQQAMRPRSVPQNALNPHLHQLHSAPGNPYQFAETRQPYFLNDNPPTLQGPYPRYSTTPEVYPHGQPVNGSAIETQGEAFVNHADSHRYLNFHPMTTAAHDHSHVHTPPCYSVPGPSHVNTQPYYSVPGPSHVNTPPYYSVPDPSHVKSPPCYTGPDSSYVHTPCYGGPTYGLVQPPPPSVGPRAVEGSMPVSSYYSFAAPVTIKP